MVAQRQPGHASASYLSTDTIAAISSALGGATALVRVSGPSAVAVVQAITQTNVLAAPPRTLVRALIPDIDDVLLARFAAPASYTGEDLVEIHTHGGEWGVRRVLEALLGAGARQALPGEFSFRAVRNGKMTVNQAEAVADLISASNDGALELALEKLGGSQNRLVTSVADSLRTLATLAEAGIDFSDQDIDEVSLPRLKERLAALIATMDALRLGFRRGERVQEGIRVAFVGLPNAGKSSFFNAVLGDDRSIVSSVPGTTRDTVGERFTLRSKTQSFTLRLEDTAGLRETVDTVEQLGIRRTEAAIASADIILLLVDASDASAASIAATHAVLSRLKSASPGERNLPQAPIIGLLTKADLVTPSALEAVRASLQSTGLDAKKAPVIASAAGAAAETGEAGAWIATSAVTGAGLDDAVKALAAHCAALTARAPGEVLLTRIDQLAAVESSLDALKRAASTSELALFAADLRQALHSLERLIGATSADDILGRIFSEFCIGK